jgi:hypothetical protein
MTSPDEPIAYDVIGNPVPPISFEDTNPQPEFQFSAPLPLPADWKPPGDGKAPRVARSTRAPKASLQTVAEQGIGAQSPYPSKESDHGNEIP